MPGLRADQVALYKKDMYKAEREGQDEIAPKYPMIYNVKKNLKGAGDKYTQLLGAGRLTRHTVEGQNIEFKSPVQGWETYVKYHTYSAGIALSKEQVEDTVKLGNLLTDLANTWGRYGTIAKEELAARPFDRGGDLLGDWVFNGTFTGETDSSGNLLYDSNSLFVLVGDKWTTKGGGTYYNAVSGATVTPANFETLYNLGTATNNRDEEDEVIPNPYDTALCLPGADKFLLDRIVDTSRGLPGQQLNDKNPYYKIIDKVIDWDYLSTTEAAFYVGKRQHKTWEFHERQSQETDFFRDNNNKGYKASVDMRMGIFLKPGCRRAWTRGGGTYA